jgi:hypothetical protein
MDAVMNRDARRPSMLMALNAISRFGATLDVDDLSLLEATRRGYGCEPSTLSNNFKDL